MFLHLRLSVHDEFIGNKAITLVNIKSKTQPCIHLHNKRLHSWKKWVIIYFQIMV